VKKLANAVRNTRLAFSLGRLTYLKWLGSLPETPLRSFPTPREFSHLQEAQGGLPT